ncbi:MAG TPA: glycosyltransferase [Longimicrobiaceae bacterium]|nr:glycosyltransferase [Longimicrobiaceae bacterium]
MLVEPWRSGGTARYAADLCAGLARTASPGDDVHLVAPEDFPFPADGYALHGVMPELKGAPGAGKLASLAVLARRRFLQGRRAAAEIGRLRPQVVHVLGTSSASPAVLRAARAMGAAVVVTVHDIPGQPGLGQRVFTFWSRHFVRAARVVVHGAWMRERLARRYPRVAERTAVIPLGSYQYGPPTAPAAELRARFGLPAGAPVVLFFGSLRRNKGLEVAIEALAADPAGEPHLFVVGDRAAASEPSAEWYRGLAAERGVEARTHWVTRYVDDAEVPDVFACADAVVLPYMRSFAGQSAVLSIAAAYGVPVIASDVGEIGPTVGAQRLGTCVTPERPAELAAAFAAVRPLRERRPAPAAAGTGSWTEMGRALWELYGSTLESAPARAAVPARRSRDAMEVGS